MADTVNILKVFVSSPSDIEEERKIIADVIQELTNIWREQSGVILEYAGWKTHTTPGISAEGPQAVIDEQILDDYDIFIGIMWTRFGTPTGSAESGTEQEFNTAYAKWLEAPKSIRVMFYFNKAVPANLDEINPEQLAKVNAFQEKISSEMGALYATYTNLNEYEGLVRLHLSRQIQSWGIEWGSEDVEKISQEEAIDNESAEYDFADDEEEGLLDLIEHGMAEMEIANEAISRMTDLQKKLSGNMEKATEELDSVAPENLQSRKRIINRVADDFSDYSARMQVEIPIYSESITNGLDKYSKTVSLVPDFEGESTIESLEKSFESLEALVDAKRGALENLSGLRDAVASAPRITTKFNRAKRRTLAVLDSQYQEINSAVNLAEETIVVMREIIKELRDKKL